MKVVLIALALVVGASSSVRAEPGQTEAQLVRWMRGNPALTRQSRGKAALRIEGFRANFSALPIGGTIAHEQIAFINMAPNWELNRSWKFDVRVLSHVYGESVSADAAHPMKGFAANNISVRLGKLYAYAAFSHTLIIYRRSLYDHVVLQVKGCGRVECRG